MKNLEVQCRCGAVRVRLIGNPEAQFYCHCDDCQAAHSAAYVGEAVYPAQAVQVLHGEPVALTIRSTPRMRCSTCGTFLFAEIASAGLRGVNAYVLPAGEFKPQFHVQCQHAVLPVSDKLPHFKAYPAAFGGSDECVSW